MQPLPNDFLIARAPVVDVWTYKPYRNQGIAKRMMELTFERLQGQHVYLFTDDAQTFYERIGMDRADGRTGYQKVVGEWLQNDTRD